MKPINETRYRRYDGWLWTPEQIGMWFGGVCHGAAITLWIVWA